MEIPVLIAAHNEADNIGRALEALSKQELKVEPVVIVNGCTDNTADIARESAATVLESSHGKLPAIQAGLRHLGKRALEPLLIMDADSRPFSRHWSERFRKELISLPAEEPAMTWGPYVFTRDINPVTGTIITATSLRVSWLDRHTDRPRTIRGGNFGLLMKEEEVLEAMLDLENYWPRDDVAIFDTMKSHGANHTVIFHPEALLLTSGSRTRDTIRRILKHPMPRSRAMDDSYAQDAPAGSKPYFSRTTDTVFHEKPDEER